MSTTIDRLEVEIQSNSTNAAGSIDALAKSLSKLQKNGGVDTAVNNLNNLRKSLHAFVNVPSNASKITSLANSLKTLKKIGDINLNASLSGLVKSVKDLDTIDVGNVAPQIERIAGALTPLNNVKGGGFNSLMNGLKKMDDVTNSLDGDKIDRFVAKIKELNDKLGPVSTNLVAVGNAFKAVNSNANVAAGGFKSFDGTVKVARLNLANLITVIQGVYTALMPVVRLLSETISDALEWDGIASRFGRGFGDQAEEVYAWVQRLNKEMGINVQQFMQYSSTYATMLTGFGVGMKDATQMALGYTELTYDIWAGYNDIYKNYSDAADAVRSAIAGEVEPIRRAGFTIVESTLEQTAANYGLEISLENATEAQKSYLRYLTLVDQAHSQNLVGTYARELNTAEGMMRTFSQQLKTLAQTFGSVFLPILVKVMPWLSAFVELLGEAIIAIANFFGVEIQKVDWGSSSGLGSVGDVADETTGSLDDTTDAIKDTTDALKDLKKATIGIDELNVISPQSSSSSSGTGSGDSWGGAGSDGVLGDLGVDSLWDEAIFDMIGDQVDKIKAKIKEWLPVIELVGGALAGLGIATLLKNLGDALAKMNLLQKLLATIAIVTVEAVLVFKFTENYLESGNLLWLIAEALVTAAGSWLLFKAWGKGGAILGLTVSIVAQLAAINCELASGDITLADSELWIQALGTSLMGAFGAAWIASKFGFSKGAGFVVGLSLTASLVLSTIRNGGIKSGEISNDSWESWATKIGSVISSGIGGAYLGKQLGNGGLGLLIGVTVGLVLNLIGTIEAKGEDFGNEISDWFDAALATASTALAAKNLWSVFGPAIKTALSSLVGKIGGWLTAGGAATLFAKIETVLASIPVWGWIAAVVVALLAGAITLAITDRDFTDVGHKLGEALGKGCRAVVDFAAKIGKPIWDGLCAAFDWCKEHITWENIESFLAMVFKKETWTDIIWPKVKEIGKAIWDGLWGGIKAGAKNLWGNITEFVDGFIQGFKDGFDIHSPSKKMISIGKEILAGLLQPLSLTGLRDKIKSMWETAKSWWNNSKGTLATYTPSIGSIYEKVKTAWNNARNWYNSKKGSMATYTPSIGSIYQKLKTSWTNAKNWWNRSKGSMSYTPTIGSIRDKLKSAWSTAKSWWSKNVKLSIPSLSFKVSYSTPSGTVKKAIVNALGLSGWPKLSFAANGGMFDTGSLIWAGEAGAEIVANAGGGKTGVMNVDQMQEAVYEGVYAAVMAAMRAGGGNGGGQAVNVYLDGKQITSAVEQRQRERGASVMGNQVYAY